MRDRARRPNLAVLVLPALLAGACASDPGAKRRLSDADFVGDAPSPTEAGTSSPEPAGPPVPVVQLDEMARLADAEATPGEPTLDPSAAPAEDASPVLIDEMVGEINGRPIFATEFLDGVGARLRQLPVEFQDQIGRAPTREEWKVAAAAIIGEALSAIIENELVTAEGYRALPEEVQQAGLRRLFEAMRADQISLLGGSSAAADRTIRQEEGVTTDELLKRETDERVIQNYFAQLGAGLSVSLRDLKREYKRRETEFNPPPTAVFLWIRIPDSDEAAYERISQGIEAGEAFEVLARDEASMFADSAGVQRREFEGEFAEVKFFRGPIEPLNEVLTSMKPGDVAGPIHLAGSMHWLCLVDVVRVSQSFYDAQVQLETEIKEREFYERLDERLRRLRERAGISQEQIDHMGQRLLEIAEDRYHMEP